MPKPLFIICSRSSAMDLRTNSLSIFDVIESLNISKEEIKGPVPAQIDDPLTVHLTAVWLREDESPDQDFEVETIVHVPRPGQSDVSVTVAKVKIRFPRPFQRLASTAFPIPPLQGEGVLRIESRVRPVDTAGNPLGTGEWASQQTYILVKRDVNPPSQESGGGRQSSAPPPPGPAPAGG